MAYFRLCIYTQEEQWFHLKNTWHSLFKKIHFEYVRFRLHSSVHLNPVTVIFWIKKVTKSEVPQEVSICVHLCIVSSYTIPVIPASEPIKLMSHDLLDLP